MGVTGFGLAGRYLRESLLNTLVPSYYLRTLEWGAVARSYPRAFSVLVSDTAAEGGYRLISSTGRLPSAEELDALFEEDQGGELMSGGSQASGKGPLDGIAKFARAFGRI